MIFSLALPFAIAGCTDPKPPGDTGADEAETGVSTFMTLDAGDGDGDTLDTGDGDGDSGDGDGDGDGGMDVPNCGEVEIVPEYIPPAVMLVVDASGSMVSNSWDHDNDQGTPNVTRWFSLHGVVDTIMTNYSAAMYAGLQRFPSASACDPDPCYNATSCTTQNMPEVDIALDNGVAILGALPGPMADNTEIEGGTPATKGFVSGLNHIKTQPPELPRYMLLITDGAANCNTNLPFPDFIEMYDETLPTTVEDAFMTDGIPTFVVGIDIVDMLSGVGNDGAPEANPYQRLNDVALAGGVPKNMGMDAEKFYNATNQIELLDALNGILGTVTDCTIDLTMQEGGPPDPIQIPYVTFTVDGMPVPFVDDCSQGDGWTWIEEGLIMTFCGSYCDDFKNGTAVFDGTYGCPPPG